MIKIFNVQILTEKAGYERKSNAYKRMSASFNSGTPALTKDEVKELSAVIRSETALALVALRKLEKK